MKIPGMVRRAAYLGVVAVALTAGCGRSATPSAAGTPKASTPEATASATHVFHGTVEGVDMAGKKLSVANENIPGWMDAMTMSYAVSNPGVLSSLNVGDRITATVHDRDYQTLYDVTIAGAGRRRRPRRVDATDRR